MRRKFRVKKVLAWVGGHEYAHYKVQMRVFGIWWTIKTYYNDYPNYYATGSTDYAYENADQAVELLNLL